MNLRTKKNKKVKNATKCTYDGIKFRSKLELFCYKALKENDIKAEYEGKTFTLVPPFEYNGEKVRPMTFTPDFTGTDFIIETKGFSNDAFPLRWKLFKYMLHKENKTTVLYLVKNQKEVTEAINKIKNYEQG